MTVRVKSSAKRKRGPSPEGIFSASLAFSDRHQYRHLMPNRSGETVLEKFRGDVYACIRLRAVQLAKIPLRVYVETRRGNSQKHRARWRCRKLMAHEVRRAKALLNQRVLVIQYDGCMAHIENVLFDGVARSIHFVPDGGGLRIAIWIALLSDSDGHTHRAVVPNCHWSDKHSCWVESR